MEPKPGTAEITSPMESAPFTEPVYALAAAYQTQHQTLLALQKEQKQRFLTLLQGQEKDRTAVHELFTTAGSSSRAKVVGL